MDDIIRKIIEVERVCAEDIENAALEYKKNIETLRYELENKKAEAKDKILERNRKRYRTAVDEANDRVKNELNEIRKEKDLLIKDKELCKAIKGRMVSIVLGI